MPSEAQGQLISLFEKTVDRYPYHMAIICDDICLTYQALDEEANKLAHYLLSCDIHRGDIVGILLPRSLDAYIAMLAIYKVGAIYVPIAEEYPSERINHILGDMPFTAVLTCPEQRARRDIDFPRTLILAELAEVYAKQPKKRPASPLHDPKALCYIIYTSGSTGKPNGVAIGQRSICHFVTVASSIYGISAKDKIYHGFSLAFDASFEEIWMAFANGATLVVATSKDIRSGLGLIDFLNQHRITVLSTVPTLLANLRGDVASLRLLILGGENCTENILLPWARQDLRILNTYGPTEATVVATFHEYHQGQPITIGKPLPGYDIIILNEDLEPATMGATGELCIAGEGLAHGYVNRAEITAVKFIPHPHDPTRRLYRTGDLAQWNENGDLVFMGRLDDQVKLRGFRLELNEIETLIMTYPGIKQAVVSLQAADNPKLVAYFTTHSAKKIQTNALKKYLSHSLPAFMLPSIYEHLADFPLLASGKVNRKALPIPQSRPKTAPYHAPTTGLETKMAQIFAQILQQPKVSITDDFFYDLGGHSLTAANIISQLRKYPALHHLSMLDLYQHRTIQKLAKAFDKEEPTQTAHAPRFKHTSQWRYRLCSIGQACGIVLQLALSSWQILVFFLAFSWISSHHAFWSVATVQAFLALVIGIPIASLTVVIAVKWLLLGRVKAGKHRLWGWFYWRWWLCTRLEAMLFPSQHFAGTPWLTLYYRLMGAKIGKATYINTPHLAAHDLIHIGENTAINHDAVLRAYTIENGYLVLGPITIGSNCYIGIRALLGIHTQMGNAAALDDLSLLPRDTVLAAEAFYQGSPARIAPRPPQHILSATAQAARSPWWRKYLMVLCQSLAVLLVETIHYGAYLPPLYGLMGLVQKIGSIGWLALPLGAILYYALFYTVIVALKSVCPAMQPGNYSIYSLTYLHHWVLTKLLEKPEILVMADSLYYAKFLKILGAKLGSDVELSEIAHGSPDLITVHDHGFIAAYASIAAATVYHERIVFGSATVGNQSFVGNRGILPQGTHLDDGGLIGCLSILPHAQAPIKHATWLGSPAMLLPNRAISQPHLIQHNKKPSVRTKIGRLLIEFLRILIPSTLNLLNFSLLYGVFQALHPQGIGPLMLLFPAAEMGILLGITALFIGLKWVLIGRYKPDIIPLWDMFIRKKDIVEYTYGYFMIGNLVNMMLGSPFATIFLRSLGTKIGRYAYIETASFEEFDLIRLDNEVSINANAIIQTHLFEDRIFKMSHIHIGSCCNIGQDAIVLYDTIMEPYAQLGPLSLLMKGETLPKGSHWTGSPAQAAEE